MNITIQDSNKRERNDDQSSLTKLFVLYKLNK